MLHSFSIYFPNMSLIITTEIKIKKEQLEILNYRITLPASFYSGVTISPESRNHLFYTGTSTRSLNNQHTVNKTCSKRNKNIVLSLCYCCNLVKDTGQNKYTMLGNER